MKWKGTDISTKGLVALTQPDRITGKKKVEIQSLDGSDQTIVVDYGYGAYETYIQFYCSDPANLDAACAFLQGSGALIDDDDATKYVNAKIIDEVRFRRMGRGHRGKTAQVDFYIADPFRYLVTEANTTRTTTPTTVTNQGTYESLPLIKITGSGTVVLTINGSSFTYVFDTAYVYVDSQSQRAYHTTTEKTSRMTGDFPKLAPGSNTISWTGTITELVITPRSRYL